MEDNLVVSKSSKSSIRQVPEVPHVRQDEIRTEERKERKDDIHIAENRVPGSRGRMRNDD